MATSGDAPERPHAFVVWIESGSDPTEVRGSAEHVATATRCSFSEAAELMRFFEARIRAGRERGATEEVKQPARR